MPKGNNSSFLDWPQNIKPVTMNRQTSPFLAHLFEKFAQFLEDNGYLDSDWREEQPNAIDKYLDLLTKESFKRHGKQK